MLKIVLVALLLVAVLSVPAAASQEKRLVRTLAGLHHRLSRLYERCSRCRSRKCLGRFSARIRRLESRLRRAASRHTRVRRTRIVKEQKKLARDFEATLRFHSRRATFHRRMSKLYDRSAACRTRSCSRRVAALIRRLTGVKRVKKTKQRRRHLVKVSFLTRRSSHAVLRACRTECRSSTKADSKERTTCIRECSADHKTRVSAPVLKCNTTSLTKCREACAKNNTSLDASVDDLFACRSQCRQAHRDQCLELHSHLHCRGAELRTQHEKCRADCKKNHVHNKRYRRQCLRECRTEHNRRCTKHLSQPKCDVSPWRTCRADCEKNNKEGDKRTECSKKCEQTHREGCKKKGHRLVHVDWPGLSTRKNRPSGVTAGQRAAALALQTRLKAHILSLKEELAAFESRSKHCLTDACRKLFIAQAKEHRVLLIKAHKRLLKLEADFGLPSSGKTFQLDLLFAPVKLVGDQDIKPMAAPQRK